MSCSSRIGDQLDLFEGEGSELSYAPWEGKSPREVIRAGLDKRLRSFILLRGGKKSVSDLDFTGALSKRQKEGPPVYRGAPLLVPLTDEEGDHGSR